MFDRSTKLFLVIGCITVAIVCVSAQSEQRYSFNTLSPAELELLLFDVATSNPTALESLRNDPELRKQQIASLRELLAMATQAHKEGLSKDPINARELENIRSEVTAVQYDKEINKGRESLPPLGYITDAQVTTFWAAPSTAKARQEDFAKFLDAKLALSKANNPQMNDREITEEEKDQAKDFFAKVSIYDSEYRAKRNTLPKDFNDKVDLQVKLQQAQFLARLYSEKIALNTAATDSDVDTYIAAHPEFDLAKKKAKAEQMLNRAKAGEDFAKLANEFSEDPGNEGPNGLKQGGIYRDVPKGTMVPEFESAALSLEPGQVFQRLVETKFGYHIIKLEKKNVSNDVYDARHILISTGVKDPDDPGSNEKPLKEFVRTKIEAEKEARLMDRLIADNNIQVPDDFVVPEAAAKPKAVKTPVKKKPPTRKSTVRKRK